MKHWGIKGRVVLLALGPAAVIAVSLAWYFTSSRINDLERSLTDRGLAVARQLAPAAEYGVFSGNRDILEGLANSAKREADVTGVVIADAGGTILATAGRPSVAARIASMRGGAVVEAVSDGNDLIFGVPVLQSETRVTDFPGDHLNLGVDTLDLHRPSVLGRVTVEISRLPTVARRNELLFNSLLITLLGLTATALLALRMSRGVTDPIYALAQAVERIRGGDFDVQVGTGAGGELQVLEDGVNAMAASLKSARDDLQERVREATARLSYQATHDTLTGLVNRREFDARLERAAASSSSQGSVHALCYMDLDQFKIVNDTCGHDAGDELLRQISELMQGRLRERDTLARLGGDEFGLLLENCPLDMAYSIVESLRQAVQDYRFAWGERVFSVGASFGLLAVTDESGNAASLMSAADAACYTAKDMGRNRIHLHRPGDGELARRRGEMQWVSRITHALEEDRFELYYQTIMPLSATESAEEGTHFEILLRMRGEDGVAVIPPMAFIPAAERYNLMRQLDRWVISRAFFLHARIPRVADAVHPLTCTVNLSGASLCDEHFLAFVRDQFAHTGVIPSSICFEITETAAIINLRAAVELMTELKKDGCRFSLDDFGSGLSSFTYLKNLPVDYLKIDGAFVKDMASDPIDFAMVQSINRIGHVIGLRTVAEFVESEAVLRQLKEIGVDYAQGNWIHQPRPIQELVLDLA